MGEDEIGSIRELTPWIMEVEKSPAGEPEKLVMRLRQV
jgi:hypothetical protein